MTDPTLTGFIEGASALIGLPIPAEYREGVAENLDRLMEQARLVMEFPLDDTVEAAPIFVA